MKKSPIILVVEDESLLLQAITKKLERNGMEAVSCTRAEQAIDYLEHLPELPDVIWLDYYLKGSMNGLDFVRILKSKEKWSRIPVVVVSNSASEEKVHNMMALGVEKYVLKAEYRLGDIVKTMEEIIDKVTVKN